MVNSWTEKKRKQEEHAVNKMLDSGGDGIDFEGTAALDVRVSRTRSEHVYSSTFFVTINLISLVACIVKITGCRNG